MLMETKRSHIVEIWFLLTNEVQDLEIFDKIFYMKKSRISYAMKALLKEKAMHSPCTYKISAIALDAKGDVLGHVTNSHSWNVLEKESIGRAGTADHAEARLLKQYRQLVKTIIICRVGRGGDLRPIDPCPVCQKIAAKYGAKIVSVMNGEERS